MTDKLEYIELPIRATEFRGNYAYVRERFDKIKAEFEALSPEEQEAKLKDFGLDGDIGCYCND